MKACINKEKLNEFLDEMMELNDLPGLAVGVSMGEHFEFTGVRGYRDFHARTPLNPDDIFHCASVSKLFTATAVLKLVEKGAFGLYDRICDLLPLLDIKDERFREIRLWNLLTHTSGLGDVDDYHWDNFETDERALARYVYGAAGFPIDRADSEAAGSVENDANCSAAGGTDSGAAEVKATNSVENDANCSAAGGTDSGAADAVCVGSGAGAETNGAAGRVAGAADFGRVEVCGQPMLWYPQCSPEYYGVPETDENGVPLLDETGKPKKLFRYSNIAYEILGQLVAEYSGGLTYEDFVAEYLMKPAGMNSSTMKTFERCDFNSPSEREASGMASPHEKCTYEGCAAEGCAAERGAAEGGAAERGAAERGAAEGGAAERGAAGSAGDARKIIPVEHYPYNRYHAPSSTLTSNVSDLLKWGRAHLRAAAAENPAACDTDCGRDNLLQHETYDSIWREYATVPNNGEKMGLGWFIRKQKVHWDGTPRYDCDGTPRCGYGGNPQCGCGGKPPRGCDGNPQCGCGGKPPRGCDGNPQCGWDGRPPRGCDRNPQCGRDGRPPRGCGADNKNSRRDSGMTQEYTLMGHEGTDDGFRASFWICPELDLVTVVLSNLSGAPVKKINKKLFDLLATALLFTRQCQ